VNRNSDALEGTLYDDTRNSTLADSGFEIFTDDAKSIAYRICFLTHFINLSVNQFISLKCIVI